LTKAKVNLCKRRLAARENERQKFLGSFDSADGETPSARKTRFVAGERGRGRGSTGEFHQGGSLTSDGIYEANARVPSAMFSGAKSRDVAGRGNRVIIFLAEGATQERREARLIEKPLRYHAYICLKRKRKRKQDRALTITTTTY